MMQIPILFEDEYLLVVNKPPGVVVNRAQSVKEETIQDWAYVHLSLPPSGSVTDPDDFASRAGIVHRIDKETSGCLLIAKNPEVFTALQEQFKERTVKKTYMAVVHGILPSITGEISAPVGRLPWNRERFGILPGGKPAITNYRVIQTGMFAFNKEKTEISSVEVSPQTGRTHQIRVHLKYINHPIVGDWQYAGRKTARRDRQWAPRVMLHAWKISFDHPVNHSRVDVEAPIPDDMNTIISEAQ